MTNDNEPLQIIVDNRRLWIMGGRINAQGLIADDSLYRTRFPPTQ